MSVKEDNDEGIEIYSFLSALSGSIFGYLAFHEYKKPKNTEEL